MLKTHPPKPLSGLKKQSPDTQENIHLGFTRGLMKAEDRRFALRFLLFLFFLCVTATFIIILLQGWKAWGFNLPIEFLQWLGGAIIAELAAIIGTAITAIFKGDC